MSDENLNDTPEVHADDSAEFDAAFDQIANGGEVEYEDDLPEASGDGEEQPVEDQPEEEVEEDLPLAAQGEEEDPFANLPDAVRERLEAAQRESESWQHRYNSDAGRVSALQRKINELETQLTSKPEEPEIPDVDLTAFAEDYPDIAKAVQAMTAKERAAVRAEIMSEMEQVTAPFHQAEHERFVAGQTSALDQRHADWREVATSQEFTDWLHRQPQGIQSLAQSDLADEVSFLMDTYKGQAATQQAAAAAEQGARNDAVGSVTAKRNKQLADAAGVPSQRVAKKHSAVDDFEGAFNHFARKATH